MSQPDNRPTIEVCPHCTLPVEECPGDHPGKCNGLRHASAMRQHACNPLNPTCMAENPRTVVK
jgi:hypothetical protein